VARRFGEKGRAADARLVAALTEVGISDAPERLAAYPHQLSGGQKQRVMIALALLCQPRLLIADEPTTALDVTIQKQILNLIRSLRDKRGMGVVLITHNIGVVAEYCDEVVVMYAGRVVEQCAVGDLFARNRHPYTRGLLESLPRRGLTKDQPLATIEGSVPSLWKPPVGCRFASRCSRVAAICHTEDPALRPIANGHHVACHHPLGESGA
jgi:peptide/nickel transport system ATP-binding protein